VSLPSDNPRPLISDAHRRVSICPWDNRPLSALGEIKTHDALLASVGYEPRSRVIAGALGQLPPEAVAVEFSDNQTDTYRESLDWFNARAFHVNREYNDAFLPWLQSWMRGLAADGDRVRVAVDISSMNRPRIAAVVQVLSELPSDTRMSVDFLYAPSHFEQPVDLPPGVLSLRPVSSYFTGPLGSQSSPVALAGLGYEPHKAPGALESLEIRRVLAYVPVGPHPDFRDAVINANEGLLGGPEAPPRIEYDVLDPFDCVMRLDGRVNGLLHLGEVPALVPLGPKIFALCECLVAAMHHPFVAVWRASFDTDERPIRRRDEGVVCGITVRLEPALPSIEQMAKK
jgi:hypothetical protein